MNNEEKILSTVENLSTTIGSLSTTVSSLDTKVDNLEQDVQSVKEITLRMEQDHGKKLTALFDGYTANYEIIERYDLRVTKLERAVKKLNFELAYLKVSQS
ncbi:MAG: hypothetical protein LBT32_02370 [Peptococcaceae bacterium]|nr:hypothetical protein [Peptococcaceae bacterium]